MSDKVFSNTRTKSTWKPRVNDADLPFYERECGASEDSDVGAGTTGSNGSNDEGERECEGKCGREKAERGRTLFLGLGTDEPAFLSDPGRNPVFNLPYATLKDERSEQEEQDKRKTQRPTGANDDGIPHPARLIGLEDLPEGISFDYAIVGGYNNNAIEVSWSIDAPTYQLQWIALKTFTGMQLKYLTPKKKAPVIFALADEDAYVYCDESPCLECVFMCKRGFVIYANVTGLGIVKFPLTRASAYWQSKD